MENGKGKREKSEFLDFATHSGIRSPFSVLRSPVIHFFNYKLHGLLPDTVILPCGTGGAGKERKEYFFMVYND